MKNCERTLIIWRRLGREHGEGQGFRLNTVEVVDKHIAAKVDRFRRLPEDEWRWWQLGDDMIIEKPILDIGFTADTVIYYFIERNWAIIENINFPSLDPKWHWYIHIAEFDYSPTYGAWIMIDMFADILVEKNRRSHTVLDLDELANAERIGLINSAQTRLALKSCQELLDLIQRGDFPPEQITESMDFMKSKAWR